MVLVGGEKPQIGGGQQGRQNDRAQKSEPHHPMTGLRPGFRLVGNRSGDALATIDIGRYLHGTAQLPEFCGQW
ncbi:putative two-component sensor histidine kinase/response regulator hybrid protein [Rhodovulum sulfidophilum]|uniref:Putative two-component sensor histidine kinase/response regulator hybrid protein n=1 Tax=Rhodovulum sulfidophilum TaxID=35806 RepID=A0A0D6AXZ4_RHOSU|nr:putative two-component sensor histidine kinase/response regulator hybrid protein [Rhodovulum sulfidophilum]